MKHRLIQTLVATAALFITGGHARAAQITYTWANQPTTSSYRPDPAFTVDGGTPISISRASAGNYHVRFGSYVGLHTNVQVSMYGDSTGYCALGRWGAAEVDVHCYDAAGRSADRRYTVIVFRGETADQHDAAYLWLDRPSIHGQYPANAGYTFPERTYTIRSTQPGIYNAMLGDHANGSIAMMVSGAGNAYCAPLARSIGRVVVSCRNASGTPEPRDATLLVLHRGFGDASFATSTLGGRGIGDGWASDGSAQSVHRLSTGRYTVRIGPQAVTGGVVQASSYFSNAICHVVQWSGGAATIRCDRNGHPVDSAFTVTAIKAGSPSREVHITERTWSSLLHLIAGGLRVHINDYDASNRSPLTCIPDCECHPNCPPAYHALLRNGSVISYHSSILGAAADFTTRFTPQSVWRNPFLFLLNDINLESNRIQAHAVHGQVVVDLPFESNGREVATACHSDVRCGWGPADRDNKPNAEINNLVIHVPFALTLDRSHGAPHILTTLGRVTYDADVRRAGACRNNALAAFCDIFGGDIEGQIRTGIQTALNGFVAHSTQIQDTINRGVNTAVCQLARAQGQDCARLSDVRLESNGDITLVF